jgi:arsenical pump membrane protein
MLIAAIAIFVVTLALVIWQPKGLGIGWSALGGAAVALATGVVHVSDIPQVWDIVWNATLTFVAVIIISLLLDAAGFFAWAALHVARWARGNGRLLFALVILLGAGVAALFANDGAALILTPVVLEMLLALGYSPAASLAFVMATGFVADTTSLPLVVSNLVNIVSADYFHISFAHFAAVMVPVDVMAIAASLGMLWLYFGSRVPRTYPTSHLELPATAIRDRRTFLAGWIILGVLLLGYFAAGRVGLPISAVAGSGALVLAMVAGRWWPFNARAGASAASAQTPDAGMPDVGMPDAGMPDAGMPASPAQGPQVSGESLVASGADTRPGSSSVSPSRNTRDPQAIDVSRIIREAPWQVVLFSLGMYLVVFGLRNQGLTHGLARGLDHVAHHGPVVASLVTGFGAAGMSSVMNNMPSVLVGALAIHDAAAGGAVHQAMMFANVVGCDLGPKITPIGSLATLLWLHVLDRKGMHIGWGTYMRVGVVLTIPVLALTLLALAGWLHVAA